jgi:hypothetical protein
MGMITKRMWLAGAGGGALLALAVGGFACVGSEESPSTKDAGTGATTTPDTGSGPLDSGEPGDDGSGGNVSDAGEPGADSGDASGGCTPGALQCSGSTPQACVAGVFQNQTPCSGAKPLCSNGVCGSYIVAGGIRSTVPAGGAGDAGTIRLVEGAFEVGARSCTTQGVCVTGGIVP